MRHPVLASFTLCAALLLTAAANAQPAPATPAAPAAPAAAAPLPPTTPYGTPITLEQAKKAADAAEAEARKRNMFMAIAIVEPSGDLVYFRRMDGTQYASIKVAQDKARSAALYRRSSKDFFDRMMKGDMSGLTLAGAVASAGGIPIVVGGKIVGAIGVSGGADDPIAQAGADALK
jgi:glc operon protein GlcG